MSKSVTPEAVMELLKSGEITDEHIRDMMGGSTRVQSLTDRCVLARIKATRGPTTAVNKAQRNELAADKGAQAHWLNVTNKLFKGDSVRPVTAAYHQVRELLTVGKTHNDDGSAANETGVNFGLGKWDGVWTVVPRARQAELEIRFDSIKHSLESGKADVQNQWSEVMSDAEEHLGTMYDEQAFPDCEMWLNKFNMHLEIIELPAFDMRISMDALARGDLAMQVKKATMDRIAKQMVEAWSRNAEVFKNSVAFTAAVLGNDADTVRGMNKTGGKRATERKVPIAKTLLPNLRGQAEMTMALAKAAEDTTLVQFVTEVQAIIGDEEHGLDADTLAKNEDTRETVAKSLTNALKQGEKVVKATHEQAQDELDKLGVEAGDDLLDFM